MASSISTTRCGGQRSRSSIYRMIRSILGMCPTASRPCRSGPAPGLRAGSACARRSAMRAKSSRICVMTPSRPGSFQPELRSATSPASWPAAVRSRSSPSSAATSAAATSAAVRSPCNCPSAIRAVFCHADPGYFATPAIRWTISAAVPAATATAAHTDQRSSDGMNHAIRAAAAATTSRAAASLTGRLRSTPRPGDPFPSGKIPFVPPRRNVLGSLARQPRQQLPALGSGPATARPAGPPFLSSSRRARADCSRSRSPRRATTSAASLDCRRCSLPTSRSGGSAS